MLSVPAKFALKKTAQRTLMTNFRQQRVLTQAVMQMPSMNSSFSARSFSRKSPSSSSEPAVEAAIANQEEIKSGEEEHVVTGHLKH